MQYENLLGAQSDCLDLKSFSTSFFQALEIVDGEERESGNYVGGSYFKGSRDGMRFIVAVSDESAHSDLPYWIHISGDMPESGALEVTTSKLVHQKALPRGFRLARMINFGKRGEQRIDY